MNRIITQRAPRAFYVVVLPNIGNPFDWPWEQTPCGWRICGQYEAVLRHSRRCCRQTSYEGDHLRSFRANTDDLKLKKCASEVRMSAQNLLASGSRGRATGELLEKGDDRKKCNLPFETLSPWLVVGKIKVCVKFQWRINGKRADFPNCTEVRGMIGFPQFDKTGVSALAASNLILHATSQCWHSTFAWF